MKLPELSIIVPAYNEAAHLHAVITELANTLDDSGLEYEICIVDNGSTDDTALKISELEKKHTHITHIHIENNQQYGGGIQAGLAKAKGEVLGWVHADGQADPEDIVRLYRVMRSEGRELAKAIRVERHERKWRLFQSGVYYWIFQLLYWTPYHDINGTPRLLTRHAAEVLKLESRDWFLEPEFVIKSLRHKMPIAEVETVWRSRRSGSTRAHIFTGLEFFKNMLLYRFGLK